MRSAFGRGVFACRGADRADLWCPDVVWRRVVAASVVGAAPEPGLAVGQCEKLVINGVRIMALRKGLAGINAISCGVPRQRAVWVLLDRRLVRRREIVLREGPDFE